MNTMIFFLIYFSICKQIYDFTRKENKNLLLYIDPHNIIEIKLKRNNGVFFSSWNHMENLTIEAYTEFPIDTNDPYETFNSDSSLIGVFFTDKDYSLRILNEGDLPYKLFVILSDFIPGHNNENNVQIPNNFSVPIFEYAKKGGVGVINLINPFIFNKDSSNQKCENAIHAIIFIFIFFVLLYLTYGFGIICQSIKYQPYQNDQTPSFKL